MCDDGIAHCAILVRHVDSPESICLCEEFDGTALFRFVFYDENALLGEVFFCVVNNSFDYFHAVGAAVEGEVGFVGLDAILCAVESGVDVGWIGEHEVVFLISRNFCEKVTSTNGGVFKWEIVVLDIFSDGFVMCFVKFCKIDMCGREGVECKYSDTARAGTEVENCFWLEGEFMQNFGHPKFCFSPWNKWF